MFVDKASGVKSDRPPPVPKFFELSFSRKLIRLVARSRNDRILTTGQLTCFGHIEILHDTQALHALVVIVLTTRNDLALPLTGGCRCALRSNRHESETRRA